MVFYDTVLVSGGSHTPSANNYIGIGPFSEVETRQLSRYVDSIGSRLTGFLSFRSFGQRLVLPFAHTTEPLYNYNEMVSCYYHPKDIYWCIYVYHTYAAEHKLTQQLRCEWFGFCSCYRTNIYIICDYCWTLVKKWCVLDILGLIVRHLFLFILSSPRLPSAEEQWEQWQSNTTLNTLLAHPRKFLVRYQTCTQAFFLLTFFFGHLSCISC